MEQTKFYYPDCNTNLMSMKKIVCLVLIMLFSGGFVLPAIALDHIIQTGNHSDFQTERPNHKRLVNPAGPAPLLPLNESEPAVSKATIWQWDTIMMYDSAGLYGRCVAVNDINGNPVSQIQQHWINNTWMNYFAQYYTYNNEGKCMNSLSKVGMNNTWVNYYLITCTYDVHGNLIYVLGEEWQTNAWVTSYDGTTIYNSQGNEVCGTMRDWQNNTWVNNKRDTIIYDALGRVHYYIDQDWQSNHWVDVTRETYSYDVYGNLESELWEHRESGTWTNYMFVNYTVDSNGDRLAELWQKWGNTGWVNDTRSTYTYDAHGNSITGKVEIWENNTWQPAELGLSIFSDKTPEYYYLINLYRYEATFKSYITGIPSVQGEKDPFAVFPNPSSGSVIVETEMQKESTISVLDLSGRELIRLKTHEARVEMDISQLPAGIYFFTFVNDTGTKVRKLIRE